MRRARDCAALTPLCHLVSAVRSAIERLLELPAEQDENSKRPAAAAASLEDALETSMGSTCGSADLRQLHNWALSEREDAQFQAAQVSGRGPADGAVLANYEAY